MTKASVILTTVAVFALIAQGQSWQWANSLQGPKNEYVKASVADDQGNVYITGTYNGDATIGLLALTHSDTTSLFLAKLNSAGQALWAKSVICKSKGANGGLALALDPHGDIILGGYITFFASDSFTIGDSAPRTDANLWRLEGDAFIAKYKPNGIAVWVKRVAAGANGREAVTALTIDNTGAIYATGYCFGSSTAAGTSIYYGDSTRTYEVHKTRFDAFAAKYDNNGKNLWFQFINGTSYEDLANDIAVDNQGNAFVIGTFKDTLKVGPLPYPKAKSPALESIFLVKLDASTGTPAWAQGFTDSSGYKVSIGTSVAAANGSIYIAGQFMQYLGLGSTVLRSRQTMYPTAFIAKLKTTDGSVTSSMFFNDTATSGHRITDMALKGRTLYTAGFFGGKLRSGSEWISSAGSMDAFAAAVDTSLAEVWALGAGGTGTDTGSCVAVGGSSVFLGGVYKSASMSFPGSTAQIANSVSTTSNAFIAGAGLSNGIRTIAAPHRARSARVTNVRGDIISVMLDRQNASLEANVGLLDITGRIVASERFIGEGACLRAQLNAHGLPAGRYVAVVTSGTSILNAGLVIIGE
jgi:hypothetical protein